MDLNQLLAGILKSMEDFYQRFLENGPTELIDEFKKRCVTLGRRVKITGFENREPFIARAFDLDSLGGLTVELPDGNVQVIYNAQRVTLV